MALGFLKRGAYIEARAFEIKKLRNLHFDKRMTLTHSSIRKVGLPFQINPEEELVSHLVQSVTRAGICSDPVSVINFYVALKFKPLAILAGPERTGKIATVRCLARVLTGGNCSGPDGRFQCQMMEGHPCSAAKSGNVAFFTGLHTRYNSEKLLCLIEEAWRTENLDKVFLACLTRISPAELEEFFTTRSRSDEIGLRAASPEENLPPG